MLKIYRSLVANTTDIIYLGLLLASIVVGNFVLKIDGVQRRKTFCTLFGTLLVVLVSGRHAVHSMLVTTVNAFIIVMCPSKHRAKVSFVFCFGYLVYFKYLKMFSPMPPPEITNCIQMMLTLKMAGLAMELQIIREEHSPKPSEEQAYEEGDMDLGFWDVFHYAFCYVGVLVGPYYRYRTYRDFFNAPFLQMVDRKSKCLQRFKVLPIYAVMWIALNRLFPTDHVDTEEFYGHGLAYKLLYLSPVFLIFRLRLYMGFVLGECVCIAAGLGCYPARSKPVPGAGPTNVPGLLHVWQGKSGPWAEEEFSYEAVHNVQEAQAELSVSMRQGIRSWNRTVQYWLAVYFYKRLPLPKPLRTLLTMSLSAVWHGLQPGYFLCLVTSTAFLFAEEQLDVVWRSLKDARLRLVFQFFQWFLKMQSFTYMLAAFLLLDLSRVYRYYREVYFLGHVYVVCLLLWRVASGRQRNAEQRLQKKD